MAFIKSMNYTPNREIYNLQISLFWQQLCSLFTFLHLPFFPYFGQTDLLLLLRVHVLALELHELDDDQNEEKEKELIHRDSTNAVKRQAQRVPSGSGISNSK